MRASRPSLAAWLALTVAAHAAPCGTVVLPTGLGSSAPNPVTGLNPLIGSSVANGEIENVIFRPLLWVGRQADVDWPLSIATSVDVSDDGMTWHVALGDWRWSDGAPVTADDVAYCLELIRRMGDLWPGKGYGDMPDVIKALDVTGPRSFDLTLAHATSRRGFLLNGLAALVPLPRHAWGGADIDEMWRRQTDPAFFDVVDGPYKVSRLELGRYAVLEANPLYSGAVKPTVERVVVSFLEGVDELRALQSGDVDAADVPLSLWQAATGLPGLRLVEPPQGYSFNYYGLNFENPAVPFFGDLRVRQAMADAIDPARVIALAYHGQGYDMRGPVPPQLASLLGADAPEPAVRFDPARARALLDEAGWAPGPDGVREKDGRRLSFALLAATELQAQSLVDQIVQREFADVGVEMRIEQMSFTQLLAVMYGPKSGWEAFHVLLFFGPWPDGGPMFGTGGANNNGGWSDARMDAIGARMHVADDAGILREYQGYVSAEQPVIFLPDEKVVLLARAGLEGLTDFLYPNGTWAPEYLRVKDRECDARSRQPS